MREKMAEQEKNEQKNLEYSIQARFYQEVMNLENQNSRKYNYKK